MPGHLLPFFRPGHLVPSFIMGINAILLCVKIYFLNRLLDKKITFDQMHIGKFYHVSCNTVLCRLFNSANPLCLYVCYLQILLLLLYCRRILSEVNLKGGRVCAGGLGGLLDLDR